MPIATNISTATALSDDEALRQKRVAACLAMLSAPTSPTSPRPSIRSAARACNLPKSTVHRLLQQARGGSPPTKRARRHTSSGASTPAAPTIARRAASPPRKSSLTFILCVSDAVSNDDTQQKQPQRLQQTSSSTYSPARSDPASPSRTSPAAQASRSLHPLPTVSVVSGLSSPSRQRRTTSPPQQQQRSAGPPPPATSSSALSLSQLTTAAERARSGLMRNEDDTHAPPRLPRGGVLLPKPCVGSPAAGTAPTQPTHLPRENLLQFPPQSPPDLHPLQQTVNPPLHHSARSQQHQHHHRPLRHHANFAEDAERSGALDPAWALMSLMQRPTSRTSRCSA